jgi:DNA-binding MarR family transcriptional regulator
MRAEAGESARSRSRLRFEILNTFVDQSMRALSRSELAVWLCLYRDTKPSGTVTLSLDDLAERCGLNRQTAWRAVASLKRGRLLKIVKKGGLNRGPTTYRVAPYPMP